jgi:DNA recombination protein RmuC
VLCSPLTLYAFLVVIRQAADNARVEEASREILGLLGAFGKEWARYTELMDKLGKGLEQVMDQYEALTTTRARKLEHQLDKIEALRSEKQIALPPDADESRA